MRGLYFLLVVLLTALLFMPTVSICDQPSMEPAITPLESHVQPQAMVGQDAQASIGATEYDGRLSQTTETIFTAPSAELEVSAVALSYKPVAAGQDRCDSDPLDEMNALVNVTSIRFITSRYSAYEMMNTTDQNEHSTTRRPVRYHQRT